MFCLKAYLSSGWLLTTVPHDQWKHDLWRKKKKKKIKHYPFTCYMPSGLSVPLHGTGFYQTLGSQMWTSATLSSAQQFRISGRETIFGKIRLWVIIITHEHTKLLIAEHLLFTVSCSESVADFMDISHVGQRVYCTSPLRCMTLTHSHTINHIFQLSLIEMTENLWAWRQSTAEKKYE